MRSSSSFVPVSRPPLHTLAVAIALFLGALVSTPGAAEQCADLQPVAAVPGEVQDIDFAHVLSLPLGSELLLQIHDSTTGETTSVPGVGTDPDRGVLTPIGAIFETYSYSAGRRIWEWTGDTMLDHGPGGGLTGNGAYAIWSLGAELYLRDSVAGQTVHVSSDGRAWRSDVRPDGKVYFGTYLASSDLFLYENGTTTQLTSDADRTAVYPLSDGEQVVFARKNLVTDEFQIALLTGTGTIVELTPWRDGYFPVPRIDYAINGGYVAWGADWDALRTEILLREPDGTTTQVASEAKLDSVGPNGLATVHALIDGTYILRLVGKDFAGCDLAPQQYNGLWADGELYVHGEGRVYRTGILDCVDRDFDGVCDSEDCDPDNPHCGVDCIDADGDFHCAPVDCDDSNPNCITDCTDLDEDGVCAAQDCDDRSARCTDVCVDEDADGVAVCAGDCDDTVFCLTSDCGQFDEGCGSFCIDGDPTTDIDTDLDSFADCVDNCPLAPNDQADTDGDGIGNACDVCGLQVDTTEDGDDGECDVDCTLREAISLAGGGCSLRLAPGSYELTLGDLVIRRTLTLIGSGVDETLIVGTLEPNYQSGPIDVFLGGLTLLDGTIRASAAGSAPNSADVTLSNMVIRGGGAIVEGVFASNPAQMWISKSVLEDGDGLDVLGRDVWGEAGGRAVVRRSEIRNNRSAGDGGGIRIGSEGSQGGRGGVVEIYDSTISGNVAGGKGGGIYGGHLTAVNCTISNNSAFEEGGGIASESDGWDEITLEACTLTGNVASAGGGLKADVTVQVGYTVLGNNVDGSRGPDCAADLWSWAHNLIEDPTGCTIQVSPETSIVGLDPLLGPLHDHGGFTRTQVPQPGSPLVDAAVDTYCTSHDQRGVARPQGPDCDIGSVELAANADGDDYPDSLDGCPHDPLKTAAGLCGCGIPESYADADLDGAPDCADVCPEDPDMDGDGFGQLGDCGIPADCLDSEASVYPGAPEINDGLDNQCSGEPGHGLVDEIEGLARFAAGPYRFTWSAQPGATKYQVARARSAEFTDSCQLLGPTSNLFSIDNANPGSGNLYYYLVHAIQPNVGSWGARSSGSERVVPCAPFAPGDGKS